MQLYIVLAIMLFMIVSFILGKWSFGLTAMTCCVLLVLTGIYSVPQAFAGLCNQNVILVAGMFVVTNAFGKTSLIEKIRLSMVKLQGTKNTLLLICLYGLVIVFSTFLPSTGVITIMMMFLMSLNDTGDITPSRMLLPVLALNSIWTSKIPLGMGAAGYANLNVYYEGLGATPDQLLQMFDRFKVCIVPCLILTVYCLFAYKLMPTTSTIDASKLKEVKKKEVIPKQKEYIIYTVFVLVMVSLFMSNVLGGYMYIVPTVGAMILVYTKAISPNELKQSVTSNAVWMLAGVLIMANALGDTGAGEVIGNGILKILGGNPSGLFVMFVFAIITVIMTTFMSNGAVGNVLIPIAASTCLAAGWDPRGIVLLVSTCAGVAIAFPSGSPACAIAYAAGNYKISKTLKFTLPFIVIAIVSLVISANAVFPIYGK
ncbi:MAG TPA: anion permease [Candidatus Cottocaccamicrobium excrementipullorum]|nr:anion permease [Candidatus Cottocaccamicrobium excrementipullorum]